MAVQPKKKYTIEFKLAVIREVEEGKPPAQVARDHEIHPSTVARWRKQYGQGKLVLRTTSDNHSLRDILLIVISIAIALASILFIEQFIVKAHLLLGSEKGILSLETVVVSVLVCAFVGNEVLSYVLYLLARRPLSKERRSPSIEETLSLLLAVVISAGIYKAYGVL